MTDLIKQKAKLRWRCHRGMLELDILLMRFFDACYDGLSTKEKLNFESLLQEPDPDIYAWIMGHQELTKKEFASLVQFIQSNT